MRDGLRDEEGPVEGREPQSGGISYAALSYAAVTALSAGIAMLLWQVWINTGRITALEVEHVQHEKIDLERSAALNSRIQTNETRMEREHEKLEVIINRLEIRVDNVSSVCEQLSRRIK